MDCDDVPLAIRRPRRSNFGIRVAKDDPDTVPELKTPRKRKVRFSDPGPSSSSGLTPMIRRTTLCSTPSSTSRRRASTPATARRTSAPSSLQEDGTRGLHHTIDGRVERRQRRSALRNHLQKLDASHQKSEHQAKTQIAQLRSELRARDREIYELQNATIIVDTDRVCDLELRVEELQGRLRQAESAHRRDSISSSRRTSFVDWTMAARDPFEGRSGHMDLDMGYDAGDEDVFGDATVAQLQCGTPTRARSSFPTPPATSPCDFAPETPSIGRSRLGYQMPPTPSTASTGIQAMLPDLEKQSELESLQRETQKLATTLENYKELMGRLVERLPEAPLSSDEHEEPSPRAVEETMELRIGHILRTLSDRTVALTTLTSSISTLGFAGNDAAEMLNSLTSSFRAARLELEYLTPGEITLPLTSHGAEVLDLLLARLRELAHKAKEGDDAIDEYHSIELNLRQQLDARVSAMDDLKANLASAQEKLGERTNRAQELEIGNERLKGAIEGYLRDMAELERLVEKMESESKEKDTTIADRDATIADLETRVASATKQTSDLQDELEVAQASRKKHLTVVNRRSGEALALRDARVAELREEIDRVNAALREAHETIRRLRVSNGEVEGENDGLREVVEGMKAELQKVMSMSEELFRNEDGDGESEQTGRLFSGKFARRSSGKKRRRYDSGLGFLDEDEADVGEE